MGSGMGKRSLLARGPTAPSIVMRTAVHRSEVSTSRPPHLSAIHRRSRNEAWHRMNRFSSMVAALVLASAVVHPAHSAGSDDEVPTPSVPPAAGEYKCHTLAIGGTISTPYGAAPTVTVMPSGIVSLQLDGQNIYTHSSGSGRYHYDSESGALVLESGPFQGWSSRSETDGEDRWLRLAATKNATLAPTSRLGDHMCPHSQ